MNKHGLEIQSIQLNLSIKSPEDFRVDNKLMIQ